MAAADARGADQERPVPERSDITALDPLAQEARFVAWRIELRGDKPTKVPYSPHGGKAKADDPSTWGTRAEAEAKAAKIVNGLGGGLGLELGDLGDGTYVAGVDLDSCITDGNLANWAKLILAALPTYAEVSPSGQGIKAFFYLAAKDVRPFLELVGITYPKQWGLKRAIGEDARDHGPAVEVYFAGRFFAVTGDRWVAQPDTINMLDWPTLEELARLIPPTRSGTDEADKRGADNSRSAIAFRKGAALRRAGKSCDEMVAALRTDPETADWVRNKGDANGGRELRRIWDRAAPDDVPDYTIRVTGGLRHQAADKGLAAMLAAGVEFYQRDRMLVRVCCIEAKASDGRIVAVPAIVLVTTAMLGRALGQSARWEKVNSKGELIRIDPPKEVVEQIAGMTGEWPFPPLTGVIGTPTLRPDGSLLTREGYDSATGLALLSPPPMPRIPDEPTWDDAEAALTLLNELLAEFPFANDASRSVAMSMLITPILRGALPPAVPLHIVTAPEAGTGKSYLADIASAIAVGDRCAALAIAPKPEETEKRLIGAALAGLPIISLDNVSDFLFGDFLCQATERPVLQIRPLGTSVMTRVANTFTTFANGNNLTVAADVVRRTLQCSLDADMEDPETRTFSADPVAIVLADRGRYIAACLTIARAYIVAGRPGCLPPHASFEGWSNLVRSALCWLNWPDPVDTVAGIRAADPIRQERAALFNAWAAELGCEYGYQTSELIAMTDTRPAWRDAVLAVGSARFNRSQIDPRRFGNWLRGAANTIAAGHKLTVDRHDVKRPRWILS